MGLRKTLTREVHNPRLLCHLLRHIRRLSPRAVRMAVARRWPVFNQVVLKEPILLRHPVQLL